MFAGRKSTIQERKYASIKRYDDTAYISKLSNLYSSILKPTKLSLPTKLSFKRMFKIVFMAISSCNFFEMMKYLDLRFPRKVDVKKIYSPRPHKTNFLEPLTRAFQALIFNGSMCIPISEREYTKRNYRYGSQQSSLA